MARKSRKDVDAVGVPASQLAIYLVAIYIRLSVEDNKKRGNSIESQRSIIENYIALNPDFKLYDVYIDNGMTGTNFEREGFKRMMEDVEAGKVNCVIVKDLSRLGRNVIDTGYYIEKYFPIKNVRFISVNDNFDTEDTGNVHGGIILPLKNMINEAYSLDIGRKIRSQARQSMKDGDYIGARPPYGYAKSPDNCHKLIIDEETAPVVRQIFEWAYEKAGMNDIVKRLNDAGIIPPSHYKRQKGLISHDNLIGNGKWQTFTVAKILSDEVYTGDMVQGKTTSVDHKQIPVSRENWIVVRDTHAPIISREIFDTVQTYREQVTKDCIKRGKKPYSENIFKGKVFCGCCGGSLHRQRSERKRGPDTYWYHCIANSRIAKGTCEGVMINEIELRSTVLSILLGHVGTITGTHMILRKNDVLLKSRQAGVKTQITVLRQDIDTNRRFLKSLYESLVTGILTDEEYFSMKAEYEAKIALAMDNIARLENERQELETQTVDYYDLASCVDGLDKSSELTAALVDKLIDKVTIYPDKRIEVCFRFQNEFDRIDEVVGQCVNM